MKIQTQKVKLSAIKLNPDNPRKISKVEMDRLVKSLADFPEMMQLREIIVGENMVILGGNMRYQALKKIKVKDCTIKIVEGLTNAQKREFIIKDNSNFGEYDWDILANDWNELPLDDWGVGLPMGWSKEKLDMEEDENTPDGYGVYIECESEVHQLELLSRFNKEGIKCRAFIS